MAEDERWTAELGALLVEKSLHSDEEAAKLAILVAAALSWFAFQSEERAHALYMACERFVRVRAQSPFVNDEAA